MALLVAYGLARVRRAVGRRVEPVSLPADDGELGQVARQSKATGAWWVEPRNLQADDELLRISLTAEIVKSVAATGQPLLLVRLPSSRLQARTNVGSVSAMLIPRRGETDDVERIAVLVRVRRRPFSIEDLLSSIAWSSRQQPWPTKSMSQLEDERLGTLRAASDGT